MDRRELTRVLASLNDAEFTEVVNEARGIPLDVKSLIERELATDALTHNTLD